MSASTDSVSTTGAVDPTSTSGGGASTSGAMETTTGAEMGGASATTGQATTDEGSTTTGGYMGTGVDLDGPFILGADVSSVQEAMDGGATYVDTDGQQKSIFNLLKAHGFNAIRLRSFVDPGATYGYSSCGSGGVYADTAHNVSFGRQAKEAGMRFLLDLHYSDTWADPDKQVIPEDWRGASTIEQLADYAYQYTEGVVTAMIDGGARPDWVQVGNEITHGMMIHTPTAQTDCYGNNSEVNPNGVHGLASSENWPNLGILLKAGVDAVKAVDPTIAIVLHIENKEADPAQDLVDWVDAAVASGVSFDILGISCYSRWHGPPSVWKSNFETVLAAYPELHFVVAEYNPNRTEVNQIMLDLPNGRGLGTFFWEPTLSGEWGQSMFDQQGNTYSARSSDFAEYDAMLGSLGL